MTWREFSEIAALCVVLLPGAFFLLWVIAWNIEITIMKARGYWHDNSFHGRCTYVSPTWRNLKGQRPDVPSRFFIP